EAWHRRRRARNAAGRDHSCRAPFAVSRVDDNMRVQAFESSTSRQQRSCRNRVCDNMSYSENNLIWIDLEMTGLSPEDDRIIEIATLVTDHKLNILAEGPVLAVTQSEELLAGMDEWNTKQHGESGLVER